MSEESFAGDGGDHECESNDQDDNIDDEGGANPGLAGEEDEDEDDGDSGSDDEDG